MEARSTDTLGMSGQQRLGLHFLFDKFMYVLSDRLCACSATVEERVDPLAVYQVFSPEACALPAIISPSLYEAIPI